MFRAAFQKVFDADPSGMLANKALFWIGQAPGAMFKLGLACVKMGDLEMAKQTLQECVRRYSLLGSRLLGKKELKRISY